MALNLSQYLDPGVYIGEVIVPGAVSAATVPLAVCLVGIAKRDKRANNEALTRGLVSGEALTVAATPGAHDATLINLGNRQTSQTVLLKDSVEVDSLYTSFLPATKAGLTPGVLDFTTLNKLSLALDGKQPVTLSIADGGGDSVTVTGSLIAIVDASITLISAITAAEIADAINLGLGHANSVALGYGPAYGAVATEAAGVVTITSPLSTPTSDVQFFQAYPSAQDRTAAVFTGTLPFRAPTVLRLDNSQWDALASYEVSYVALDTDVDDLAQTTAQSVIRVGSYAGVTSFKEGTDFSVSTNQLDWSADAAATFTSSISAATYDISTNDTIVLAFDGKAAITIDLNALASPPPGYTNPSSPAAATLAEIAVNINAVLAAAANYGPKYRDACTISGTQFVLTSSNQGRGSFVEIAAPSSLSASTALFGLASSQLPYSVSGTGSRPVTGAIYFATYEYTRPAEDYDAPKRFFTPDSLYADVGFPLSSNQLAVAGGIAFENAAPSVIVVQADDSNFPGSPTQSELLSAIAAAGLTASATEICTLSTALATQVDQLNHVVSESSATQKNYRRGWFGMARGTLIGDKDTPDTFVYRSTRTLQVPGDSPGRGRMILVAPSDVTRTIVKEDGSEQELSLDGSYLAVAVAAKMTSFTSPAETLLRKNVSGFKTEDFQTYLKQERALLAGAGVTVVTQDAGRLVLLDPMTTEGGGGRLINFSEISASTQKDGVTTAVTQSIDSNLVGVVPSDLSEFITTIKSNIAGVLQSLIAQGSIAPFKDDAGVSRDIDFVKDIQVFQDVTDPTKYYFRYFFNLRYPAKRFYGEYSTDRSFF